MTTSITTNKPVSPPTQDLATRPRAMRATRAMGVVAAVIVALAVWAVAELALGIELREPPMGGGDPEGIGARQVAVTAAGAALAAWGLLAILERWAAAAAAVGDRRRAHLRGLVAAVAGDGLPRGPSRHTGRCTWSLRACSSA